MNLAEIALRRQKERLDELLKEQRQQEALEVLKQGWKSVQPYLKKAYVQLQLMNPITIRRLLENYPGEEINEYFLKLLLNLPATPEEAKIQLLANMVIDLVFPKSERKIETII